MDIDATLVSDPEIDAKPDSEPECESVIPLASSGLLSDDNAVLALARFSEGGKRAALVTLLAVDGGSPRPVGAQMVVGENGLYHGYLSGGCLEQAIALEAQSVMAEGQNRLVRYGKGSPYFDVRLPCGSGLDVYFDRGLTAATIAAMLNFQRTRRPFTLTTDLTTGAHHVFETAREAVLAGSSRDGNVFHQIYAPAPRIHLIGTGPIVPALSQLCKTMGIATEIWAADEPTRKALDYRAIAHHPTAEPTETFFNLIDPFTAVVMTFHDHDNEPKLLARLLQTPCFYAGVLGNHAVHRRRVASLKEAGENERDLARIHAPIGSIPGAKSVASLAVGILAEIVAEAKAGGILA